MRRWIVLLALLWSATASAAIPTSERDALLAIYQSANGSAWTNKTNWTGAVGTECTWYEVQCDDTQSNVVGLFLQDNHLDGTVPASIRNLTKLRDLHLWSNDLRGTLPSAIGDLAELESFYVDRNHFVGTIPTQYGALKKLKFLGLSGNQIVGPLPAQFGDLLALEEANLSDNLINGTIPIDLVRLTNLKVLDLSVNRLNGTIPSVLGSLPKLEQLLMTDNQLGGAIPSTLGNLTTLNTLRLGYNQLTGSVPSTFGQLRALEFLDLRNNQLSGAVPETIGDLAALKHLDLAENDFTGTIPTTIFRLNALEELHLGDNQFTGTISPQIGTLDNLQVLSLYANQLTGSIPTQLSSLALLRSLELQMNDLAGPIPAELGLLTNVTGIDLAGNRLSGSMPPQLGGLAKLEILSLYENALEGAIPSQLGDLASLRILYLGSNQLTGGIPDALRKLTNLEQFSVNGNRLSGTIPSWIGDWTKLTDLFLGFNQFSGTLPPGLGTLENLSYLDLGENQFTGRLMEFDGLPNLVYLTIQYNQFSGPIPASIGSLTKLDFANLASNDLSGPLPPQIGGLASVTFLSLVDNELEGAIPKEIAQLRNAYNIGLCCNHFSGTIPREIGELTQLQFFDVSFNALVGPIPPEITAMTGLEDHRSDFSFNGLYTTNQGIRAFVNLKQYDGDFEATQTVKPANVRVVETTDRSVTLAWDRIRYEYYGGGYQVAASSTPNGPVVALATTSSKSLDRITVRNLQPATTYFFTVATVSHPISGQPNLVTSDRTTPIQATTKQRVIAPAEVVMTDTPNGMVQIDGLEVQADSFTLTNFGDVATSLTLERNESFLTIAPEQFSLAAGASQIITVHSVTQPVGTYYGYVAINGAGVPEDLYAEIILLASARPSGTVVATPLATRIELAGEAGSDEVGTAQFRNTGTARLTGIVLSDQPWVEVDPEPITIDPGTVGSVNFRIVRSKRPGGGEGALTANLSLVYVSGSSDARTIAALATTSPVSITKVTIVDVTQPSVVVGSIPPLLPGEVPLFIPGLTGSAAQRSDVSLINATGSSSISDLQLYFTGGSQTSIASLQPLAFEQSVNLVNILGSVYGTTGSGAMQVRSASSGSITAGAKVTVVTDDGTYSGALPVFRADRSSSPGETIYLAGLTQGGDLLVQETGGSAGGVDISFLNAAGLVFSTRSENIGAYALVELRNVVPANAVTAIIISSGAATITATARLHETSGDTWSVVDWSRFYDYERTDSVRVPFADGRGGAIRRRAARHDAPNRLTANATPRRTTDLVLFNPTNAEVLAAMEVIDTTGRIYERTKNVPARATVTVNDVASLAGTTVAHVVVAPGRGELVVTARTHDSNSGSAIPVVSATNGIRLGQSQVFAGLDDAATLRTGYGFAETGGATAKVRARIIISETNALVSTVTERTFTLAAREQIYLPELVRSFAGDLRDTAYGDLHGLVLEVEVIEGAGAIVPFVMATDVGTEDVSVVVQ